VVAVVLIFVLTGGNNGPLGPVVPGGPDNTVPEFSFSTGKAIPIPTVAGVKAKKLKGAATQAQSKADEVMDSFYTEAFLDPANWRDGSYDDVFKSFSSGAAAQAQKDLATLTAGSVGGTIASISPAKSTLSTRVLMDSKGQPASIVALVKFSAKGSVTAGGTHVFSSVGQYFLEPVGGNWQIVSFDVKRKDQDLKPSPTPSGSTSTSGSPS